MKYVAWAGGIAALVGAILVSTLAGAAVGDAIYMAKTTPTTISAAAKTNLANAVLCSFPAADTSKIQIYRFWRHWQDPDNPDTPEVETNMLSASGVYETTQTHAQYVTDLNAGVADFIISADGSNVTYDRKIVLETIDTSCIDEHDTFTSGLVSRNTDQEIIVECRRLVRGEADIECGDVWVKTASPSQYVADDQAGVAVRFLGQVTQ